ncbi:MAG: protein kinase [Acidobacteriota bacterium]|nr:MAG: protein kinase [Acidobacteriota bacterium]
MIGRTVSHYNVTGKIGEGGMGEVYRATDTRLNRSVALKVLPDLFADDPQRMGRFSREAQVLASLNHPNIASIFGFEDAGDTKALVMEFVEGEDLSDRVSRGPLPLQDALKIALQLAEALESAHDKGVIHRDLKPANIKITPQGQVKVLDFGLAKALEGDLQGSSPDLTRSPTLSLAATQAGIILGTAGYMSPEQAKGTAVDRRGDIWAFGVILLEMITGQRTFSGDTMSETMAAVIKENPRWESLPKDTPAVIQNLLRRCLLKDPTRRLQAIGEARLAISDYLADPDHAEEVAATAAGRALPVRRQGLWITVTIVAMALAAALGWMLRPNQEAGPDLHLSVQLETEQRLFTEIGSAISLSPDGTLLAYISQEGSLSRSLHLRRLNQLKGNVLSGTEGAYNQFFSPDGDWIGFFTRNELKKVSVSGGTPLRLCEVNLNRGGTWAPDGTIIFAASPSSGLSSVAAAGGTAEELTVLGEQEVSHRWPQVTPDGKAVIFTVLGSTSRNFDEANIEALSLETGERKVLQRGGTYGSYVPTGHLVYFQQGTLFAAPFDLASLELSGSPAPILENVVSEPGDGGAQSSIAASGLLAYIEGTAELPKYGMFLVDDRGRTTPLSEDQKTFAEPRFSPDGSKLAVQITQQSNTDAWIYDLKRGVSTRLTFDEGNDVVPIWSPDGRYIAYTSDRHGGPGNVYLKLSDGTGEIERLTEGSNTQWVSSWSPDGKYLLFTEESDPGGLYTIDLEGDRTPQPFLETPFNEAEGTFSPDGRWIAYQSTESGQTEVYVRPFPASGGKWQVSTNGGSHPRWSLDGKELYYRKDGGIMVVPVNLSGSSFQYESPRQLFDGDFSSVAFLGSVYADYDVGPDGRFIMLRSENTSRTQNQVVLITNWFDRLNNMVPSR